MLSVFRAAKFLVGLTKHAAMLAGLGQDVKALTGLSKNVTGQSQHGAHTQGQFMKGAGTRAVLRAGSHSGSKTGGACAHGRLVRVWGGGNLIIPRAWSFKSKVRAAMSLSRPAPLRQFQSSQR